MTAGDQKILPYLWVTKTVWPTLDLIPKSGRGAAQSRSEAGPGGGGTTKVIWGCNLKGCVHSISYGRLSFPIEVLYRKERRAFESDSLRFYVFMLLQTLNLSRSDSLSERLASFLAFIGPLQESIHSFFPFEMSDP